MAAAHRAQGRPRARCNRGLGEPHAASARVRASPAGELLLRHEDVGGGRDADGEPFAEHAARFGRRLDAGLRGPDRRLGGAEIQHALAHVRGDHGVQLLLPFLDGAGGGDRPRLPPRGCGRCRGTSSSR